MTPAESHDQEQAKSLLTLRLIEQKIAEASARHQEPLTLRLNLTAIAAWLVVGLVSVTCWLATDWKNEQDARGRALTEKLDLFIRNTGERTVRLEATCEQHERRISKTEADTTQLLRIVPLIKGHAEKTIETQ